MDFNPQDSDTARETLYLPSMLKMIMRHIVEPWDCGGPAAPGMTLRNTTCSVEPMWEERPVWQLAGPLFHKSQRSEVDLEVVRQKL